MATRTLDRGELELRLLASVHGAGDVRRLQQQGLDSTAFEEYAPVWDYFVELAVQQGRLPRRVDLEVLYGVTLGEPGDLEAYAAELRRQVLADRLAYLVSECFGRQGLYLQQDPQAVLARLQVGLQQLQPADVQHTVWWDRDSLQRLTRLTEVQDASQQQQVIGIPTGLRCFDEQAQGWGPGEAVMVMAAKGVGKTWLLVKFAVTAYVAGRKVLFLSPEMSWSEIALRLDVFAARATGYQAIRHGDLQTGKQEVQAYSKFLEQLQSGDQRLVIVDSPAVTGFTAQNIMATWAEHRPDLVVLDGLHLVRGDAHEASWERLKQVADLLKATAQHYQCAVIWSSQVDRESMRNPTEPAATGASAAYSKAAVEAASRLITLGNSREGHQRKVFKVPHNRSGREYHTALELEWEVDRGLIEQVPLQSYQDLVGDQF